ncbi:unnamed protein product [Nezara viridula]|uniref:DUF4780 domain-containing protein n=1 Tax=Nezara viridula TaxID=85310 RepID=A0A9P0H8Y6_NEZVI|nr:unnamed protein product [Nezara viridula]
MRYRGSKISKIIEVEQPWKPRRNRRNRKWREGPRNMQAWSTKIIKLLDDDMNGRSSPCSVVSFSLSLDNQIEDMQGNSEWIRTAHIKDGSVNEPDRRSPLFTGRMLRRNHFADDNCAPRRGISYEFPSDGGHNPNTSRLSIRERLEPPHVNRERPEFDIPSRLESPEMDIHHDLKFSNMDMQQHMEGPLAIRSRDRMEGPLAIRSREHIEGPPAIRSREAVDIAVPPEQFGFRQNHQDKEPHSHLPPRDEYDAYNGDRLARNGFPAPQRARAFRRSLYFPPGYRSPPKNSNAARQKRTIWPWLKTSADCSEDTPDYTDHYVRRDHIDFNAERFERDPLLPPGQRQYEQPEYYRPHYLDHSGNSLRESRSEMSLPAHEIRSYPDYRSEACERNYSNRRDDGRFDWSYSRVEAYGSSFSPQRFNGSRSLQYSPGSPHPPHDSFMGTPQYRSLMESPSYNWEGPHGRNYQHSYQDSFSDEDFTDSDLLDNEEEEPVDKPKTKVQQMWKTLVKERGILVSREGASAAMNRESAHHVKKFLIERASDPINFIGKWRPRFLRSGLVRRSGLYQMVCKDHQTVTWTLKQAIPPLEGTGFKILKRPYDYDCGPVRVSLWLYSEPANPHEALQGLDAENPGIGVSAWRLVSVDVTDGWRHFTVDVGRESAIYLESNGWTILYWNTLLPVTRILNKAKQLFCNQLAGDNP